MPYSEAVATKKRKRVKVLTPNPAVKRAADQVGTQIELARLIGVGPVDVSEWIHGKRKVPAPRCVQIEQVTNGAVTRRDLRSDWAAIWPELVEA